MPIAKRDSWVTTVLVDKVMSDGDEDSTSCFSQPKRMKSTDIQRDKILKYLQINEWGNTNDADLAAGLGLVAKVSLVYVFEASFMTLFLFYLGKSTKFFRNPWTIIVQTVTKMIQFPLYVKK